MGYRPAATEWPHGQPTIVCPVCHGSGLSAGGAWNYLTSRQAPAAGELGERARVEAVRCGACEGRGRQTVAQALAAGHRVTDE